MNRKIFVLGAGASIGAERIGRKGVLSDKPMPGAKTFFNDISHMPERRKPYDYLNFFALTYEKTHELVKQAWNIEHNYFDPEEWKNVDIEELLTFFDIGTKLYTRGTGYHGTFLKAFEYLVDFIQMNILIRSVGQRCQHLEKLFQTLDEEDSVFSFNWDTISDSTLDYIGHPIFDNYLKTTENFNFDLRSFQNKGMFLKLHGSLNWVYCRNKNCNEHKRLHLIRSKHKKPIYNLDLNDYDKVCKCGERKQSFIIPPVSNKDIIHKNSFINKNWRLARNSLPRAREIIFIGYSFPKTDFYSLWLFRQLNFLIDRSAKIVLVNPETEKKKSSFLKNCKHLFSGLKIELYRDLEHYIESKKY